MENPPPTLESFEDVVQNDIIIENLNEIGEVIFTFDEGLFEEISIIKISSVRVCWGC